jgi:multiple sugar transport system ATP-binding protein
MKEKEKKMAGLKFVNVRKEYGKNVVAVEDFNLDVAQNEFIVLVGPSGCGKSTTLRMVAGLEDISGGELYIGDKLVNNVDPRERDIAMVFQSYALYPHMTVYDNMGFALKMKKVPKAEIKAKVMEAARILDIEDLLKRRPKALSGGQRQRVAIGRAMVRDPEVFLMDEPLSNLDAKLRNQMRAEIIRLRSRINTTFIYVTHDQTEAMTLGDRIVIMNGGKVQQVGTPNDVFYHPANIFVAGFIGVPQMNFFDGKLTYKDGKYSVIVADAEVELTEIAQKKLLADQPSDGSCKTDRDVIIGIRPEHIVIRYGEAEGAHDSIPAVVGVAEPMGSEMLLHVDVDPAIVNVHNSEVIVRVISHDATIGFIHELKVESKLNLVLLPDLLHVFDKQTKENLIYPYAPAR